MSLFGTTQKLSYGTGPGLIELVLTNDNFYPKDGDGHLPQLGYDCAVDQEALLRLTRTAMGSAKLSRPIYTPFQFLTWSLKLSQPQLLSVWGMWRRQQVEKLPVIVDDQRLAMLDITARARAKIGTVTGVTAPPGCAIFWPRLAVLLKLEEDWNLLYNCAQTTGFALVNMTATEMFFLEPSIYDLP
jgi:hypothetical protein